MLLGLPRGDARSSPDPRCGPRRSTHTTSTSTGAVEACPLHRKLFNHHIISGLDSKVDRSFSLSAHAREPSPHRARPDRVPVLRSFMTPTIATLAFREPERQKGTSTPTATLTDARSQSGRSPLITVEPDRPPRVTAMASGAAVRVGLICGAPTTSDARTTPGALAVQVTTGSGPQARAV